VLFLFEFLAHSKEYSRECAMRKLEIKDKGREGLEIKGRKDKK